MGVKVPKIDLSTKEARMKVLDAALGGKVMPVSFNIDLTETSTSAQKD